MIVFLQFENLCLKGACDRCIIKFEKSSFVNFDSIFFRSRTTFYDN